MMKKMVIFLLAAFIIIGSISAVAADDERQFYVPDFNLTEPGASWTGSTVNAIYHEADGGTLGDRGWYELSTYTTDGVAANGRLILSGSSFTLLPNRQYRISFLMKSDFDHTKEEVSIGFREYDEAGNPVLENFFGVQNTSQWTRVNKVITTSSRTVSGRICGALYGFFVEDKVNNPNADPWYSSFCISDLYIFELPGASLADSVTEPGEGMVFSDGSGSYNMEIKDVVSAGNKIIVSTDGAEYTFDKSDSTITARQLINGPREVFKAVSSKSLANLSVHSQTKNEAVLTTGTDGITIGVQMDGLALIANHGDEDLHMTYTSSIDGKWNRLSQGNLMAKDDIGGFTVNPHIPMGTGRLARYTATDVDFDGRVNDTDFISSSKAGWKVEYDITAGEMLGMSVFPPREYDWAESFDSTYVNYYYGGKSWRMAADKLNYGADVALLWDYTQRGWGMSWGGKYLPISEDRYISDIAAAQSAGMKAIPYMSMYYWYNRDIDEYLTEVQRHRDTYGIEGVYTDGLPDKEWLEAYKGARGLRELFPDGTLIFHTTGQIGNGGSPMAVPDISIPAIDAYASITLRGEGVSGVGEDWIYPGHMAYGYNTSNAIGLMKGDAWRIDNETADEKNKPVIISQERQTFLSLLGGGRARLIERLPYMEWYQAIIKEVKNDWLKKGSTAGDYSIRYNDLVNKRIANLPTATLSENAFDSSDELTGWSVNTGANTAAVVEVDLSESDVNKQNRLKITDYGEGCCTITKSFEPAQKTMNLRVRFKADSTISGEVAVTDTADNRMLGIFIRDGKLWMMDVYGGYSPICDCETGKWHTVTITSDGNDGRYNILLDNEIVVRNKSFYRGTATPAGLMIKAGAGSEGTLLIDDVLLAVKQ